METGGVVRIMAEAFLPLCMDRGAKPAIVALSPIRIAPAVFETRV